MKVSAIIYKQKLKALTLTELLVVMVIIGVLVLMALPNLLPLVTKAKSKEAELQLSHVYRLQRTYFMERSKYSNELTSIGFEQEKLVTEGEDGRANYRIELVEVSPTTFTAVAEAVVDFDGDGQYNKWEINQENQLREVVPD